MVRVALHWHDDLLDGCLLLQIYVCWSIGHWWCCALCCMCILSHVTIFKHTSNIITWSDWNNTSNSTKYLILKKNAKKIRQKIWILEYWIKKSLANVKIGKKCRYVFWQTQRTKSSGSFFRLLEMLFHKKSDHSKIMFDVCNMTQMHVWYSVWCCWCLVLWQIVCLC